MEIKRLATVILCVLCAGCAEKRVIKQIETADVITSKDGEDKNNEDFDEICKRIAKIDLTVIAPAGGVSLAQTEFMHLLISKYGINIPQSAIDNQRYYACADTEENRLKFFKSAMKSKHEVIWTIRGGFGSGLIIAALDKMPIPKTQKTLIGFSDITSLQLFVSQKWNWKAIHAPVMVYLSKEYFSKDKFDTLLDILEGRLLQYDIDKVHPINNIARKQKKVAGKLTGGNLTLLQNSIGTCWEFQAHGKILFVEDVNLCSWRIYRTLYHLKESGRLKGVRAIVFGDFTKGGPQEDIEKFLCKFADSIDVPVYITDQFGHGNCNKPLIYNADAVIHDGKMTVYVK